MHGALHWQTGNQLSHTHIPSPNYQAVVTAPNPSPAWDCITFGDTMGWCYICMDPKKLREKGPTYRQAGLEVFTLWVSDPTKSLTGDKCICEGSSQETWQDGERERERMRGPGNWEDRRKGGEMGKERILISTLKRQSPLLRSSRE